jgi:hypothetical protein
MRFKAKLAPEQVTLLYSLIVPISRLASSSASSSSEGGADNSLHRNGSILYMDTNRLCISTKGIVDTDGHEPNSGYRHLSRTPLEIAAENNVILMNSSSAQLACSPSPANKSSRG